MADDECRLMASLDDRADRRVEAREELLARLAAGHAAREVALEPRRDGADVTGDGVVVGGHLEVAGLDLLEPVELRQPEPAGLGRGGGGLVRTHPAGDVDRLDRLVGDRLRCRDRLGTAEVGEVEAGVRGVELAGDVGVRLAVPHQQESHRGPQLLKGEVLDDASSKASSSETPSSASSMSVPTWLTSVPRSSGTRVWTSRSS